MMDEVVDVMVEYRRERDRILAVTGMKKMPDKWYEDYEYDKDSDWEMVEKYQEEMLWASPTESNTRGVNIPKGLKGITVEMSTGGPGDGFILGVEGFGYEVVQAWYYYLEWFKEAQIVKCDPKTVEALNTIWGGESARWIIENR